MSVDAIGMRNNSINVITYKDFIHSIPDQWYLIALTTSYLYFVFNGGPRFMKNRKAYNLKNILIVYNLMQVLSNLYVFCLCFKNAIIDQVYDIGCTERLPANHPNKFNEDVASHVYTILKVIDYLDTVFFVLKKNYHQVTFLHVYHHVLMVHYTRTYLLLYGTGGPSMGIGFLNAGIHIIMYSYYLYAAVLPKVKNVWWKKYITNLQLIQFVLGITHNIYPLVFRTDCNIPKIFLYFNAFQAVMFILLFGNFYIKSYTAKNKLKNL